MHTRGKERERGKAADLRLLSRGRTNLQPYSDNSHAAKRGLRERCRLLNFQWDEVKTWEVEGIYFIYAEAARIKGYFTGPRVWEFD